MSFKKNPVDGHVDNPLAAVFTMMLPGLGQMLQDRTIPGLFWAVSVGGGYLLNGWLGMVIHVACILDAAFYGKNVMTSMLNTHGLYRKGAMFFGLTLLLIYTCLRTALF